jgi:hypothetical protein
LKLLTVVPPVNEGTLLGTAASPQPLSEEVALQRIEMLLGGWSQMPSVEVAIGAPERRLPQLAASCEADLLFVSESQSSGGFLLPQISRTVDHAPCGVIIVPAAIPEDFQWSFVSHAQAERKAASVTADTVIERPPARMLAQRRR